MSFVQPTRPARQNEEGKRREPSQVKPTADLILGLPDPKCIRFASHPCRSCQSLHQVPNISPYACGGPHQPARNNGRCCHVRVEHEESRLLVVMSQERFHRVPLSDYCKIRVLIGLACKHNVSACTCICGVCHFTSLQRRRSFHDEIQHIDIGLFVSAPLISSNSPKLFGFPWKSRFVYIAHVAFGESALRAFTEPR